MPEPSHYPLDPRRVYRLRPSEGARGRGYVNISLTRGGAPYDCFAPLGGGLDLLVRTTDGNAAVIVSADEAAIEPIGRGEASLALLRRGLTSLRRSVLSFDGVEIFPEGQKAKTRRFRKQLNVARHSGMAFDNPFVRAHPELMTGWPAGSDAAATPLDATGPKLAVALHLHYVDLWDEIETLLRRWRMSFTLFLTLTREHPELMARVRAVFPGAVIRVIDNRGRDVRPFLLLLEEGAFDSFALVCKIHGKRSLGADRLPIFGDLMRRVAFLDLIATNAQARAIVRRFEDAPNLGLIGPRQLLSASRVEAPRDAVGPPNRATVAALAARMGAPVRDDAFDFFEGTMFWARPQAMAPLRGLALAADSFAPEAGAADGALEHAVERLFNHATRLAGFRVEDAFCDP